MGLFANKWEVIFRIVFLTPELVEEIFNSRLNTVKIECHWKGIKLYDKWKFCYCSY